METVRGLRAMPRFAGSSIPALLLALLIASGSPPQAFGADGDPIATGTVKFRRAEAFTDRLKAEGVGMQLAGVRLQDGNVDPTTGEADLTLGKLTFRHARRRVVYRNLQARLGQHGVLRGSAGKLFRLHGGVVQRNDFGAVIHGVKAWLLKTAAQKLSRRLGLGPPRRARRSTRRRASPAPLRKGRAGTLSFSYTPRTVKVLGGTMVLRETIASGTVGFKLFSHCVSAAPPGVSAIAPASSDGAIQATFSFPILGGTISPKGVEGALRADGGLRITKNNGVFTPSGCPSMPAAGLEEGSFAIDLQQLNIGANRTVTAAPPGVPAGARGAGAVDSIDPGPATVTANPYSKVVTYNAAAIAINAASATVLNEVFPNAGSPANDFAAGDLWGTADLVVAVR